MMLPARWTGREMGAHSLGDKGPTADSCSAANRWRGYVAIGAASFSGEIEMCIARGAGFEPDETEAAHDASALWRAVASSGFLAHPDALHMQRAPFAEGCKRHIKRLAKGRERVLNARRNFPEVLSRYDADRLHLLEMLNQHLLADSRHRTAHFSKALGVHAQCPQDEHLPFPPDHVERGLQAATIVLPSHDKGSCLTALHPYGQVSTCRTEIKIDIRDATNEWQADCTPKHLTRDRRR